MWENSAALLSKPYNHGEYTQKENKKGGKRIETNHQLVLFILHIAAPYPDVQNHYWTSKKLDRNKQKF